ncbi:DUF3084 domain-containing protein [Prochlorococcus sp. MIT 1307]|uniref:DUF3084 domain-containing protein n=1 Tax=Prochlorococcus sp. MIT 1307 TaxID=3096219 RepID=UPI002A76677C|nr:DUF3084 domain-containing protein [Prochlorococcus sp. MIT 1307]
MSGWLLIIALLFLGGILATLGDLLGSRIGKARLSFFNLRPRRTAVLITVLTGSLISAISLGLMLLVSRQLRVGLFELEAIQAKIKSGEKDLKKLGKNLYALRRGDVVISSGQPLATATIQLDQSMNAKKEVDLLLQRANYEAYRRVMPGQRPSRRIVLALRGDIKRLEEIISKKGSWAVNIRSAGNVLLGEKAVYVFPEVRPNINIVNEGEVIISTAIELSQMNNESLAKQIQLLFESTSAEIKRRGSLSSVIQFNSSEVNKMAKELLKRKEGFVELEAISLRTSQTADPVAISLQVREKVQGKISKYKL